MNARLDLRNITKRYPSVVANDGVSLSVGAGEIHAVLGENGAGKSTLMKIIYGAVAPDSGEMMWDGRETRPRSPAEARALGIGMVFQHFSLFESLTVAENIALALDGDFDLAALSRRVSEVSARYGLTLDPRRLVHSLSVGERQRVEIVRCLLQDPKLLILDEPTSVLTPQAVRALFDTLRKLSAEGCSILYISHKLHEIRELCTIATVLRGGRVTGTADPRRESNASLARMMIGRELPVCHAEPYTGEPAPMLRVRGLGVASDDPFGTDLQDISFELRAGEILGIAGISGNGQAELLSALSGENPTGRDTVELAGQPIGHLDAGARRDLGLGFIPEERLGRGAVPTMSLAHNALLTAHRRGFVRRGFVAMKSVQRFAADCIERYDVRAGGTGAIAKSLSGGNLQKFIVGREMSLEPKVIVVAQPTWGVDVGASAFIRQALIDMSRRGVAILVVSEELEELFEISDRIAVIARGRLSEPRRKTELDEERVGLLMAGLGSGEHPEEAPHAAA
jgi:general nucleoside transport system ATP-binding protein